MKKFIKKVFDILAFCLGVRGTETGKEAERIGLCDFSGQGREKTDSGEDAEK